MSTSPADLPPVPARRGFRAFYAKPTVQVGMIALTCFACPGLFNALSGIGGGGQVSADASNKGAIALNSTFAVTSFFSGTINNRLGSRLTLSLGALGYGLYISSFLSYNINGNSNFVIAAGAILGVCAGMLWTAQGAMTLAYATEQTKGRLFAMFWSIFNVGAVLGSAIELGLTYDSAAPALGNGVYAAFLVLSVLGALIPHLLVNPATMVRDDGSRVVVPVHPTWKHEIMGMIKVLRFDYWVVLLFPYFLSSNWFYTFQFNEYNGARFTLRTRALNSLLYWFFQIFGALFLGTCLDSTRFRRTVRAWGGLAFVTALAMAVWGGTYHATKGFTRADVGVTPLIDLKDSGYASKVVLYIWMGILDACWQNYAYWLIGALSNSSAHLGIIVGFYKAIQSAGAAGCFRLDLNLTPFMTMLAVAWALNIAGALFVVPLITLRIKDHTDTDILVDSASVEASVVQESENEKNSEV